MRWKMGARLGAMALGLALCGTAHSAVMTAGIQITGTGPFNISYYLAQQTATMQVKIFSESGTLIRTMNVTDPASTSPGFHDSTSGGVVWDGLTDGGTAATPGVYYARIDTTGDPVAVVTLLAGTKSFKAAPGKTESRTVYGGAVNRDVNSPYHNLAYFGIGPTNSNGGASSGVAYVRPDASSGIFPLDGKPSSYDYVAAGLLDDGTIVAAGQGLAGAGTKQMLTVSPLDGTVLGTWGKGFLDVRGIQAFGNAPKAKVYIVDDVVGGINLLTSLDAPDASGMVNIIPDSAFPGIAQRALVVNRAQTSMWVAGGANGSAGAPGAAFVAKFDNVGGTWTQDANFIPLDPNGLPPAGYIRGLALSPDESTLWIANNSSTNPTSDQVYAVDAKTGATKGYEYYFLDWQTGSFTPQAVITSAGDANNNANTSYNLFVTGYRSFAAATTSANGVAVLAPPDNGSSDSTRSQLFEVVGNATGVTVTGGPTVSDITDTSATVTWTTDFRSDSNVQLGTTAGTYTLPVTSKAATVTNHVINLQNLAPGTTYYFQVVSNKDPLAPGTKAGSFATTPNIAVTSESLVASKTSAALSFNTNVAAAATITWGEAPGALTNPTINVAAGTSHTANFTGLAAGKTYYYQMALTSATANPFTSVVSTFATAADGGADATQTFNNFSLDQKTGLVNNGAAVELPLQGVPTFPQPGPALPIPTYFAGGAAYNGYLYFVGGTDSNGIPQNTVYYAKIAADGTLDFNFGGGLGWQVAANILPLARTEIANSVFAYNGYLYVVGGSDGAATQSSVLYAPLDPTTGDVGAWMGLDVDGVTPINPLPKAVTRGAARVIDGNLVVSGGAQAGVVNTADYVATIHPDGSLGPWQTTAPVFRTIWDQSLLGNAHTAYSVGGESGIKLNSVDVAAVQPNGDLAKSLPVTNYPGHTDSTMPNVTSAAVAGIAGGKILTAGGAFNEIISGDVQGTKNLLYAKILDDKLPGPWTNATTADPAAALPNNAANLTGAVFNNVLYTLGGRGIVSHLDGSATAITAMQDVNIFILNPDPNDTGYSTYGTLESKIVDLGSLTNLQHLTVAGTNVSAANVSVRYRFANNDGVFTDWYDLSGVDGDITGGARYFQYQVVLKGASATPSVASVVLKTGAAITPPDKFGDVRDALRIAGGLKTASPADKTKLDVDSNGHIDVLDALKLDRQIP